MSQSQLFCEWLLDFEKQSFVRYQFYSSTTLVFQEPTVYWSRPEGLSYKYCLKMTVIFWLELYSENRSNRT